MILAISLGSKGSGDLGYVAYLPFALATGASLKIVGDSIQAAKSSFDLSIEKLENFYGLTAGPFQTEAEAASYLNLLGAALLWLSLAQGVGVSYAKITGDVSLYDSPLLISESSPIFESANDAGWSAT